MNKGEGLSVVKRTEARNPLFLSLCLRSIKKDEMKKSRGKREEEKESAHLLIHAVERKVESRWKGGKRDEERKRGRGGCGGGGRMRGRGRGGEENLETIGGAEAAAFHVGWHRLPLKSLLLFVSSSKIMIVCPRDLLLPRPSQCGTT